MLSKFYKFPLILGGVFALAFINLVPASASDLSSIVSVPTGITGGSLDTSIGSKPWSPYMDMSPGDLGSLFSTVAISGYYLLTNWAPKPVPSNNPVNGFGLQYNLSSANNFNTPLQDSYLTNGTVLTYDSPYISKWIGDPNSFYTFDISAITYNPSYYSNLNLYEYSGNNLIAIVNSSWSSDISSNNLSIVQLYVV